MTEMWADIEYFSNYEVSNIGNVRNKKTGKLLHQHDRKGYLSVMLFDTGLPKRHYVHRLVAKSFMENPNTLPQVNHKNGVKRDNRIENLEWCDGFYNQQHSRNVLKNGNRRVRCVETGVEYESVKHAAECSGSYIPNIVRACRNASTAAGLHWEYV